MIFLALSLISAGVHGTGMVVHKRYRRLHAAGFAVSVVGVVYFSVV